MLDFLQFADVNDQGLRHTIAHTVGFDMNITHILAVYSNTHCHADDVEALTLDSRNDPVRCRQTMPPREIAGPVLLLKLAG